MLLCFSQLFSVITAVPFDNKAIISVARIFLAQNCAPTTFAFGEYSVFLSFRRSFWFFGSILFSLSLFGLLNQKKKKMNLKKAHTFAHLLFLSICLMPSAGGIDINPQYTKKNTKIPTKRFTRNTNTTESVRG